MKKTVFSPTPQNPSNKNGETAHTTELHHTSTHQVAETNHHHETLAQEESQHSVVHEAYKISEEHTTANHAEGALSHGHHEKAHNIHH